MCALPPTARASHRRHGRIRNGRVPFFFMLSGLGVAHSRLLAQQAANDRKTEAAAPQRLNLLPTATTLLRRAASVYPTHVLGVLSCFAIDVGYRGDMPKWATLCAELLLCFAWVPAFIFIGARTRAARPTTCPTCCTRAR